MEKRKELWHLSAAPTVVTLIVVTFCLHIKTIISSNIKGGGLKGNHRLLVQKFIELIRLLTLGGNLVTCIDCRYDCKQKMSTNE